MKNLFHPGVTWFAALLAIVVCYAAISREGSSGAASAATARRGSGGSGRYKALDLGTLGGRTSLASAINNHGQVVGFADTRQPTIHIAFLWQAGRMQVLATLPGGLGPSDANAINDAGQVAGALLPQAAVWDNAQSVPQRLEAPGSDPGAQGIAFGINGSGVVCGSARVGGVSHAVLWQNGQAQDLGTLPGGSMSAAHAINSSGQSVGSSELTLDGTLVRHAVRFDAGGIADLGVLPGGSYSDALGINDAGQVVGLSSIGAAGAESHAAIWENGSVRDLGTLPGHTASMAFSVNSGGQAVGTSSPGSGSGVFRAVLFHDGRVTDLNTAISASSRSGLEFANGINDLGQIVGVGRRGGAEHAFLLTPE